MGNRRLLAALMVTIGDNPPYQRDQFDSYADCVAGAKAEPETLPENTQDQPVHWACGIGATDLAAPRRVRRTV